LAELEEVFEGALVHVVDARLITAEEGKAGLGGELRLGGSETGNGSGEGTVVGGVADDAGFDGPAAAHAPGVRGHFLDERLLDGVGGLELEEEGVEEGLEGFGVLGVEHGGAGEETVVGGVGGGTGLAFRGDRSNRESAIGAGCIDASDRRHEFSGRGFSTTTGGW